MKDKNPEHKKSGFFSIRHNPPLAIQPRSPPQAGTARKLRLRTPPRNCKEKVGFFSHTLFFHKKKSKERLK